MPEKIKGKVKWYSIRKGFGFISPSSDNAPTKEDIFFHQTSIVAEQGKKTKFLAPEYEVEFEVNTDESGKYRCQNVTAPGGGPCEIPERKRLRNKNKGKKAEGGGATTDEEGGKSTDGGETEEGGENKDGNQKKGRRNRKKKEAGEKKEAGDKSGAESGDENKKPGEGGKKKGGGKPRAPRKRFDDNIPDDVKEKMKEKKLDMRQSSLLIQLEKARIKFGPDGYAALAHADGIMAEGSFTSDQDGKVTLTWKNMLKFDDGEWKTEDPIANSSNGTLATSFNWSDENVQGLKTIETPESLWGEGKTDPAEALKNNNFQMKKCFLSKTEGGKPRGRRRPNNNRGRKGGNAKSNGEKANGKTENGEKAEEAT